MDVNAKNRFKGKFYRLSLELNIIILLFAMCIPVFLIFKSPYTVLIISGMLVLALFLLHDFIKKYHQTKAWLDDTTDKEAMQEKEL